MNMVGITTMLKRVQLCKHFRTVNYTVLHM